jgi:hypothetical protein
VRGSFHWISVSGSITAHGDEDAQIQ